MKILKYKKISRGRYKLTTDTSELVLYEDVILKNNLLYNKDITLEILEKIMNENIYYEAYDLSLSFIEKKLRTKKEVINYLEDKCFNKRVIDETIKKLESVNLLNVRAYVEAFINDKVNLGNSGPYKIKKELVNLGIDEEEINEYLNTISEDIWLSKLDKIVYCADKLEEEREFAAAVLPIREKAYQDINQAFILTMEDQSLAFKKKGEWADPWLNQMIEYYKRKENGHGR